MKTLLKYPVKISGKKSLEIILHASKKADAMALLAD